MGRHQIIFFIGNLVYCAALPAAECCRLIPDFIWAQVLDAATDGISLGLMHNDDVLQAIYTDFSEACLSYSPNYAPTPKEYFHEENDINVVLMPDVKDIACDLPACSSNQGFVWPATCLPSNNSNIYNGVDALSKNAVITSCWCWSWAKKKVNEIWYMIVIHFIVISLLIFLRFCNKDFEACWLIIELAVSVFIIIMMYPFMFHKGGKDYVGDSALCMAFFAPLFSSHLFDLAVLVMLVFNKILKMQVEYKCKAFGKEWYCAKTSGLCSCFCSPPDRITKQQQSLHEKSDHRRKIMYISLSTIKSEHHNME